MKRTLPLALSLIFGTLNAVLAEETADGWQVIFDGKTLNGWKANENPESWKVVDGVIVGHGERSHLFYVKEEFTDLEFKAEIKLNKGGNSGMYFRTAMGTGWPNGYEAQVNNSAGDPVRTGSLYHLAKLNEQLVPDDTWWNQHIICKGNYIIIKVNDKIVVDHVEKTNKYSKGYVALQQHDPLSKVEYKNLMVKPLK